MLYLFFHRTLRHPNLVGLIGVSLDEPPIYLVTEYMGKGSLQEYLRCRGRAVISKQNLLDFSKYGMFVPSVYCVNIILKIGMYVQE